MGERGEGERHIFFIVTLSFIALESPRIVCMGTFSKAMLKTSVVLPHFKSINLCVLEL